MSATTMSSTPLAMSVGWTTPLPPARTGREHQRYASDGTRLVCGAVPYRIRIDEASGQPQVEVLMISSRGDAWILPKGGWETDESEAEAAVREAYEEAGVLGEIMFHLSSCTCRGKRDVQLHSYFALRVSDELNVWPDNHRSRKWLPLSQAIDMCPREGMREALQALAARNVQDL